MNKDEKRHRRVKIRHVLLLLVVSLFAWRNWPLLKSHSEQDKCTFGTASTALYDGLRTEADFYLAKHGKARLSGYSPESARIFSDKVLNQLHLFAMSRNTPPERWAALHALLRAYGMEFGYSSPPREGERPNNNFFASKAGHYYIQLPTLNWFCPLCYVFPTARFRLRLEDRGDGTYDQIEGRLHIESLNWKSAGIWYRRSETNCPGVVMQKSR